MTLVGDDDVERSVERVPNVAEPDDLAGTREARPAVRIATARCSRSSGPARRESADRGVNTVAENGAYKDSLAQSEIRDRAVDDDAQFGGSARGAERAADSNATDRADVMKDDRVCAGKGSAAESATLEEWRKRR
jgi:hypothetical protein